MHSAASVRYTLVLGLVMALRMLGLFMVFPVLALYARELESADIFSIGLALGIYGLAQAALQIPFGRLSDRFGRKALVISGFLLFAGGSVVAAMATSIWQVVVGRFLQGSGAVAGVVTAWLADLVPDNFRTRAMALLGLCIGLAFVSSLLLGPWVAASHGLSGLFWLTAGLALLALLPLTWLPSPVMPRTPDETPAVPRVVILPFAVSIFLLHAMLATVFLHIPIALEQAGVTGAGQGRFYLIAILGSLLLTLPLVWLADKRPGALVPLLGGLLVLASTALLMAAAPLLFWVLLLFFAGFNFFEAWLPASASRVTGAERRGEMLGMYTTAQFLGIFAGGAGGGGLASQFGPGAIPMLVVGLAVSLLFSVFFAAKSLPSRQGSA